MPTGDMWGAGPDRGTRPRKPITIPTKKGYRGWARGRKVWTIVLGILLAFSIISDVSPHTVKNPLTTDIASTVFWLLLIVLIQWRSIRRIKRNATSASPSQPTGNKFCGNCGTPRTNTRFCTNCAGLYK
jgi:hypothetical protein